MTKQRIEAVLFDIDGTIIALDSVVLAIKKTCREFGLHVLTKKEMYRKLIGWPLQEVFPKLYPKQAELAKAFDARYHYNYVARHRPNLLPHAKSVLTELKRRKIKIGYVTTKARVTALYCLRQNNLPCDVLVSADDVRHAKPSPEPVFRAMKRLKAKNSETLVVGDHVFDILSGKRAGCISVGITTGVKTRKELLKAGADYVIDDLKGLLGLVD